MQPLPLNTVSYCACLPFPSSSRAVRHVKEGGRGLRRSKRASRYRYLWILVPLGASLFSFFLVPGQASIAWQWGFDIRRSPPLTVGANGHRGSIPIPSVLPSSSCLTILSCSGCLVTNSPRRLCATLGRCYALRWTTKSCDSFRHALSLSVDGCIPSSFESEKEPDRLKRVDWLRGTRALTRSVGQSVCQSVQSVLNSERRRSAPTGRWLPSWNQT